VAIPHPGEALLGEANGAILAARIAHFLGMQQVNLFTDNATVMQSIRANKDQHKVHSWKLRPMILELI